MLSRIHFVRGSKIHLAERRVGSTAVLLIHGNSSDGRVFRRQWKALERTGLSIVVPDLPGHGLSDHPKSCRTTYSFPGYADVLARLMADLRYTAVHVVGWSLGGHIGLELYARFRRFKSLLITGTPPVSLNPEGVAAGFRWTPVTALAGKRRLDPGDVRRYVSAMLGTRSPGADHLAAAARTDGRARSYMVANGMAGVGIDERVAVETSEKPLAIVQGRDDPFVRTEYIAGLKYAHLWGGAPIFLKAGHAPHWETPAAFDDHLKGFLEYAARATRRVEA